MACQMGGKKEMNEKQQGRNSSERESVLNAFFIIIRR